MAVDLRQTHFRFGRNSGTESTHLWLGNEDTNVSVRAGLTFLLRFNIQESGGTGINNVDNQFQYNLNGAGWVDITTSSAVVKAVASNCWSNNADCTKRLSGTGTFESSASGCTTDGLSGGSTNDIAANGCSETEAALQIVASAVNNNDTIQFRLTSPDGTITYTVTPSLTVIKETLLYSGVQTLSGLARRLLPSLFWRTKESAISLAGQIESLFEYGHPSFHGVVTYVKGIPVGGAERTVEAAVSLVGAFSRLLETARTPISGVVSLAGSLGRLINNTTRAVGGALGSGGLANRILAIFRTAYGGAIGFSGLLGKISSLRRTFSGYISFEGILSRLINNLTRTYSGSLALVGEIRRLINNITRSYSGSISPSGLSSRLINNLTRAYNGTLDFAGDLIASKNANEFFEERSGELTFSGIFNKGLFRTLQIATLGLSHAVSLLKGFFKTVEGASISFSGKLNRLYEVTIDWTTINLEGEHLHSAILRKFKSGIVSFSSLLNKALLKTKEGALSFSGEYSYLKSLIQKFYTETRTGAQTFSGQLSRTIQITRNVKGYLPPIIGELSLDGVLSLIGSLSPYKILTRSKESSISFVGSVSRAIGGELVRTYEGSISIAGTIAFIEVYLLGRLSPAVLSFTGSVAGSLFETIRYTAVGTWSGSGEIVRRLISARSYVSTLSLSGSLSRLFTSFKPYAGSLSLNSVVEYAKTGGAAAISVLEDGWLSLTGASSRQVQLRMAYAGSTSFSSYYARQAGYYRSLYSGVHPYAADMGGGISVMGGEMMMDMTLGL